MKPIIGITSYEIESENIHKANRNIVNAVIESGGVPVIIPTIKNEQDYSIYLDLIDGIVLTGGEDIFPGYYEEEPLDTTKYISVSRDEYEIGLFKRVYEKRISVLGICRGLQIINVALGGSLYQDIPSQIKGAHGHNSDKSAVNDFYHSITVKKETLMEEIFGKETIYVNSYHHQSIKDLGEGLKVSSYAGDGVIESIENTDERFLLGVQFHPEALYNKYPEYLKIFQNFINSIK